MLVNLHKYTCTRCFALLNIACTYAAEVITVHAPSLPFCTDPIPAPRPSPFSQRRNFVGVSKDAEGKLQLEALQPAELTAAGTSHDAATPASLALVI